MIGWTCDRCGAHFDRRSPGVGPIENDLAPSMDLCKTCDQIVHEKGGPGEPWEERIARLNTSLPTPIGGEQ